MPAKCGRGSCAQVIASYQVPLSARGAAFLPSVCARGGLSVLDGLAGETTGLACEVLPTPKASQPPPPTSAVPPALAPGALQGQDVPLAAPAPAGVPVSLVGASVAGVVVTGAVVVAALVAIRRKRRRLDEAGSAVDDKDDELAAGNAFGGALQGAVEVRMRCGHALSAVVKPLLRQPRWPAACLLAGCPWRAALLGCWALAAERRRHAGRQRGADLARWHPTGQAPSAAPPGINHQRVGPRGRARGARQAQPPALGGPGRLAGR
jgi:hypothetical protein